MDAIEQWWWDLRWWWRIPTFPLYVGCVLVGAVLAPFLRGKRY